MGIERGPYPEQKFTVQPAGTLANPVDRLGAVVCSTLRHATIPLQTRSHNGFSALGSMETYTSQTKQGLAPLNRPAKPVTTELSRRSNLSHESHVSHLLTACR